MGCVVLCHGQRRGGESAVVWEVGVSTRALGGSPSDPWRVSRGHSTTVAHSAGPLLTE